MKTSDRRIITTHVGSLPRLPQLDSLLISRDHGKDVDPAEFVKAVDRSLDYVIERQREAGIDIGSDGEQPRVSYMTYVPERMSGFSGVSHRKQLMDMVRFPKYAEMYTKRTWHGGEDQPRFSIARRRPGRSDTIPSCATLASNLMRSLARSREINPKERSPKRS